jgi:uncharacterized protein (TIGR00369 family)
MSTDLTPETVEAMITRGPYHRWLGLKVVAVSDDGIELKATWREEWVVNPDRRYTHGGVVAALIDLAADWAMVATTGRGVPTIDLRVDFHAAAMPGDLTAKGRVIKSGSQFSTAEAEVFDQAGKLLASGRGTYLTAAPPRPAG